MKRIWHWINYMSWCAIKPNHPTLESISEDRKALKIPRRYSELTRDVWRCNRQEDNGGHIFHSNRNIIQNDKELIFDPVFRRFWRTPKRIMQKLRKYIIPQRKERLEFETYKLYKDQRSQLLLSNCENLKNERVSCRTIRPSETGLPRVLEKKGK